MPPKPQVHNVAIRVGTTVLEKWVNYSIELDMLEAADGFHLELGRPTRAIYNLCAPDAPVQVVLDDTVVVTGFIDDRAYNVDRGAAVLRISGRDKTGRLVDESNIQFALAAIAALVAEIRLDWTRA